MSIINYGNQAASQAEKDAAERQEQQNRIVWEQQILANYPVVAHEANYRTVRDYCQGVITLAKFEFLVNQDPTSLDWNVDAERTKLVNAICGMMHDPTERRFTKYDEQQLRKALQYKSNSELREKLADVARRQTMAQKTVPELKKALADVRKAEGFGWKNSGYPTLAATLVPQGEVVAVKTGDFLRRIARTDTFLFKRYCRLYSMDQINFWLQN